MLLDDLKDGPDRIALFHEVMGRIYDGPAAQSQSQGPEGQSQSTTTGGTPQERVHAFLATVRALDIPARYVTGYLLDDDGAGSFHAWAEAWDDGLGWIGFDPTLNVCPAENHVRIASGLDARSCPPLRTVPVWAEMPDETVEITTE